MSFFKASKKQPQIVCKSVLVGGEAGEGIKSAGKVVAKTLIKKGYNVFLYDEYPSLIRGGHNSVNITYSPFPVYCPNREIDILICLNRETFDSHKKDLMLNSSVIYDSAEFKITDEDLNEFPCEPIDIPFTEIAKRKNLPKITQNVVLISAALCLAGVKKTTIQKIIKHEFAKKPEVLDQNLIAIDEGYDNALEYFETKGFKHNKPINKKKETKKRYLLTGNEAATLGAIRAGMQFYAAYPMTPASTILDIAFENYREYDFVVKQTEDEISAINMAIGASYAGARSMVGTSGGGFSLMVEGLGLAAITETPLVIALVQRPGPATGLPTWTAQGDLMFALHASQDEFPRIILTPTDAEECYSLTFKAFNLAEKYQLPVIVLSDKYLAESMYLTELNFKDEKIERGLLLNERLLTRIEDFNRYELTPNGISPRSIPGQKNGIFLANSDESDTKGYSNDSSENRKNKVEKRFKKAEQVKADLPSLNVYGDMKAKLCLMTWGSTKGPILEAMRRLQSMGISTKLLALNYIEPFPGEEILKFVKSSSHVVLIENNFTSQLGKLITMNTGYDTDYKLVKYDGRPFWPDEIVKYIEEIKSRK